MNIHELMKLMEEYRRTLDETGYRDDQLAKGIVTFVDTVDTDDNRFYAVSIEGNVLEMDKTSWKAVRQLEGPGAYLGFEGKDLRRFVPFRIAAYGYAKFTDPWEAVRTEGMGNVLTAEEYRRSVHHAVPPVRPAVIDARGTSFFSSNGLAFSVRPSGAWSFEDAARRYYKRDRLVPEHIPHSGECLYEISIEDDRREKLGRNFRPALTAALREFQEWFPALEIEDALIPAERISG